ncbi:hypothetical protein HKX48_001360 [Thoreauomyces humboldtii]|nr:hypothetical protein HKX48_001360 [Thoreauomyces humboldtii]
MTHLNQPHFDTVHRRPSLVDLCKNVIKQAKRKRRRDRDLPTHPSAVLRHRSSAISVIVISKSAEDSHSPASNGVAPLPAERPRLSSHPSSASLYTLSSSITEHRLSRFSRAPSLGQRSTRSRPTHSSIDLFAPSPSVDAFEAGSYILAGLSATPSSPLSIQSALDDSPGTTLEDQLRDMAYFRRSTSTYSARSTASAVMGTAGSTGQRSISPPPEDTPVPDHQDPRHDMFPEETGSFVQTSSGQESEDDDRDARTVSVVSVPIVPEMNPLPSMFYPADSSASLPTNSTAHFPSGLRWNDLHNPAPVHSRIEALPREPSDADYEIHPKRRPTMVRALRKIGRSISSLGVMFRAGRPEDRAATDAGAVMSTNPPGIGLRPTSANRKLYESRTSMVIKDVSPETAAEALAPGSSYAQVLASLGDKRTSATVRVSTSSRISMSTVYISSERSRDDDECLDDDDEDDTLSMCTALHIEETTTIEMDLRRSFSEPNLRNNNNNNKRLPPLPFQSSHAKVYDYSQDGHWKPNQTGTSLVGVSARRGGVHGPSCFCDACAPYKKRHSALPTSQKLKVLWRRLNGGHHHHQPHRLQRSAAVH